MTLGRGACDETARSADSPTRLLSPHRSTPSWTTARNIRRSDLPSPQGV